MNGDDILPRIETPRPSKSQINKLGERLRRGETPSEEDLRALQELREMHAAPLAHVMAVLARVAPPEWVASPRLKTSTTIIEKLRRESTRLVTMQDIAGARLVLPGTLAQQDELVSVLQREFPESRVVDRRSQPSHGYRAVHVVAPVEGLLVEIQVRTDLQHLWAEVVERLGDRHGRGVRYGDVSAEPTGLPRLMNQMMEISQASSNLERKLGSNPAEDLVKIKARILTVLDWTLTKLKIDS